jgi:hypothetical protein
MQQMRTHNKLGDALAWVQLTYSSLKLDAIVIFGVIGLMIALMSMGAYQEALKQAHLFLGMTPEQDAGVMQIVDIVNQYGLAALIGLCYFSNVTGEGAKRRELMIDLLTIAAGFLMPNLVFHAAWLYTTNDLISANTLTINYAAVSTINLEWVIVWAISMALVGVALFSWRIAGRGTKPAR